MFADAAEDGSLGIVVLRAAGDENVRVVVYGRTKQAVMTSNITLSLNVSIQQGLVSDDANILRYTCRHASHAYAHNTHTYMHTKCIYLPTYIDMHTLA